MKIEEFTNKYKIQLSKESKKICEDGISQMTESKDPIHSSMHALDIIDLLDQFLQNTDEVKKEDINFNVLLPSIWWHDIWKSYRSQTTNLLKFKFEQYWDGIGSARIFKKYARKYNVDPAVAEEIRYAVFHHGGISSKWKDKIGHIEARILDDLDSLDFWSEKRLTYMESIYLDENKKFYNPKLIPIYNWVLRKLAARVGTYYFKWCDEEFNRRNDSFFRRGREIMRINGK